MVTFQIGSDSGWSVWHHD